jgi:8-amino-7-oxononanoate synthase
MSTTAAARLTLIAALDYRARGPMDEQLRAELDRLWQLGLLRSPRHIEARKGAEIHVGGTRAIDFCSNDYLGFASHPPLGEHLARSVESEGTGAAASRLISGNRSPHRELEHTLATWNHAEAALLFNSGYQANVGILSALAGPEDALYSDALNHASLIDGCRLSRATVRVFPHGSPEALAALLATDAGRFRRRIILSDTIFSMDGDEAPLAELAALAERNDAWLLLDEAHAAGVVGPAGRGLAAREGIRPQVTIGTLGKAFGVFGAYVAGSHALIDFLLNRARTFVFTTALPPAVAAAARAAVELAAGPEGDARRAQLHRNVERFSSRLGVRRSHIVPIVIGDAARTMQLSDALLDRGIFVQGIRPPTVPHGTARLRFALSAAHTDGHIDRALAALGDLLP